MRLLTRGTVWQQQSPEQSRNVQHHHVAVAVDRVSSQKVIRVYVVNTKRTKESPSEHRHLSSLDRVLGGPMHDARHEVRGQRCQHDHHR